jgi:integrase
MAIVVRGEKKFLIRIYVGRNAVTKKRVETNEIFHGTLSEAKQRQKQLQAEKELGGFLQTSKMDVNRLLDHYLNSFRHVHADSTQNKNAKYLKYYVRNRIGKAPAYKVKSSDIQDLFNSLLDKGLKCSSVRGVKKVLHAAFNHAVDDKIIPANPVSKTKLPPINQPPGDSLTMEEARTFITARHECSFGLAFTFQLYTGLRPQELMALIWQDIDLEKRTIRVERSCVWKNEAFVGFGPPKTWRGARTISIPKQMVQLLKLQLKKQEELRIEVEKSGRKYGEPLLEKWVTREHPNHAHLYDAAKLVFPTDCGTVPRPQLLRKALRSMLCRAGLPQRSKLRWHDLRHTHATLLLTRGIPPHEVAKRLGISIATLMSVYAHVLPDRDSSAAETIQEIVSVEDEAMAEEEEKCFPAEEGD